MRLVGDVGDAGAARAAELAPARAAAKPTRLAIEPPLVSKPPCPRASRTSARSHSSTVSSTAEAPDPPVHEPVNALTPGGGRVGERADVVARAADAREEARVVGALTHGSTCSNSVASSRAASPGASGGGPPSAAISASGVRHGADRRGVAEPLGVLHEPVDDS